MKLGTIWQRLRHFSPLAMLGAGGIMLQIPSCGEEGLTSTFLTSIEAAVTTALPEIFELMRENVNQDNPDYVPTVMLDLLHQATTMLT